MYKDLSDQVNKRENIVGWYHSHPGYRPWLSGIDVSTQRLYQQHQEPFLAVVIDPIRTSVSGKVDIGAFRTLPEGAGGNGGAGETQQGAARRVVGSSLPGTFFKKFFRFFVRGGLLVSCISGLQSLGDAGAPVGGTSSMKDSTMNCYTPSPQPRPNIYHTVRFFLPRTTIAKYIPNDSPNYIPNISPSREDR